MRFFEHFNVPRHKYSIYPNYLTKPTHTTPFKHNYNTLKNTPVPTHKKAYLFGLDGQLDGQKTEKKDVINRV